MTATRRPADAPLPRRTQEDAVPPYRGTKLHALRIPDELWAAALEKAREKETSVNAEVVAFLKRWTRPAADPKKPRRRNA